MFTKEQNEWIETLESEKFVQHQNSIGIWNTVTEAPEFCCLGVANYLNDKESMTVSSGNIFFNDNDVEVSPITFKKLNLKEYPYFNSSEINENEFEKYKKFIQEISPTNIDIEKYCYKVNDGYFIIALEFLNDDLNFTFKDIASVLRNFPHFYFENHKNLQQGEIT